MRKTTTVEPAAPAHIAAAERDPRFGYPTAAGFYLNSIYLSRLRAAITTGVWVPDFDDELDADTFADLTRAGLLTTTYEITDAGRWHYADAMAARTASRGGAR